MANEVTATMPVASGVMLSLRKHQRIPLGPSPVDHAYIVTSGLVLIEAKLPDRERQVLEILYASDVYCMHDAPESLEVALVAATSAELQRLRPDALSTLNRSDPEFASRVTAATAIRSARRTLHLASLNGQSGDERFADFLVEIGLFLGDPSAGGRSFDLPLTREETASYLSLNPDTLSRIFSRLKGSGVIRVSRGRAVVPDWSALTRLSPLSTALTELHAKSQAAL